MEYVYSRYGPGSVSSFFLVAPLILVAVWAMQFQYMRRWVRSMAIVSIALFLALLPRTDNFAMATYLGQLILLTSAAILYAKMKDPAFATIEPNPPQQRTPGSHSVAKSDGNGPAPLS